MIYFNCPDLSENSFVSQYVSIGNKTFRFTFKWNEYCDCCFVSIYDADGNPINTGTAFTVNSYIHTDHRVLPTLFMAHSDSLAIRPTRETIKDYVIVYNDSTEQDL